ncbi:MAG TPA: helix-turn-helix transcriptional regulator [Agromyces sp.]
MATTSSHPITPLRAAMRERRVKQIPTADALGVSQAQLSKIVNGRVRVEDSVVRRLAAVVGIECPADPQALVTSTERQQ